MFLPVLSIIIIILIILWKGKGNVVPHFVLLQYVFSFILGFYLIDDSSIWLYQAGLFFVFFISSFGYMKRMKRLNVSKIKRFNSLFFYIIVFLIAYHYLVGGIPALSNNVVVDRFDFTSSGLFGIPGRMANYGRYFILFYSLYFYARKDIIICYKKYNKYFYISIVINVLCSLFAGTKAALFSLLYILVYIMSFIDKPFPIKRLFKPKYFFSICFILVIAIMYLKHYFEVYNSQMTDSQFANKSFIDYVFYRLTYMSVDSGLAVLNFSGNEKITYISELIYYIGKYFHLNIIAPSNYPLEIWASLSLSGGVYRGPYEIYSPVTIGFGSEIIYHFGLMSIVIASVLGFAYSKTIQRMRNTSSDFSYAAYGLIIFFINSFIGKGNLIYNIINCSLMIAINYCIYYTSKLILNSFYASSETLNLEYIKNAYGKE